MEGERLENHGAATRCVSAARLNSSTFESLYNNANVGYALQQTSDPSDPNVNPGNAMASFLLNVPDSAGRRNVHETTRWGGVMGFYCPGLLEGDAS